MNAPKTGTLKAWNDERGFGFVRPDDGSADVFLHIKALPPQTPRPQIGQRVRYELVLSGDGKPRAAGACLLAAGAAPVPTSRTVPPARGGARSSSTRSASAAPQADSRNTHASRAPGRHSPNPTGAARPTATAHAPTRSPGAHGSRRPAQARVEFGTATLFWPVGFVLLYVLCSAVWAVPGWVGAVYALLSGVTYATYLVDKHAAQTGAWRVSENNLLMLGLLGGWPGAIVAQQRLRHKSSKASFRQAFWVTVVLNVVGFVLLASPLGRSWLPI